MKKIILPMFLLSASLSSAAIVVRDIDDVVFPDNVESSLDFDFNNDGTPEFTFEKLWGPVQCYFDPNTVNFWTQGPELWMLMKPLAVGTSINAQSTFAATFDVYIDTPGSEYPQGDSYFGTRITLNGSVHYGWVLMNLNGSVVTFKSYAYNNVPNQAIAAGDTGQMSVTGFEPDKLSFYPNPAKNDIVLLNDDVREVYVYDMLGKFTQVTIFEKRAILSGLPGGTYTIVAYTEDRRALTSKIIIE